MIENVTPPVRLGTRGSALALWQAETVRDLLSRECPMRDVEMITVKTLGDRVQDKKITEIGRTAVFTAELDRALAARDVDIAVHSLKDVETTLAPGLMIGAILPRGPVEDALVGKALNDLKQGATVGTGSLRRIAQLKRLRPDLRVEGIRGNVPTRLEKLERGEYDALCMARAGLVRLGHGHRIAQVFTPKEFLPAVGQGAICIQCREDDESMRRILAGLNHAVTAHCVRAERALLAKLGAGCNVPVGVWTRHDGARLMIDAAVFGIEPLAAVEVSAAYDVTLSPEDAGRDVADRLSAAGAEALLAR